MDTIPQLAAALQSAFDAEVERIGRRTGLIRRARKFTAVLLLKVLVFTLLRRPGAQLKDYVTTAAQLGLTVSPRAVRKRLTPRLVAFLREVLAHVLKRTAAAAPVKTALLGRFTAVYVGDSTAVVLPDECRDEFPGCGGKSNSGRAALKLQVVWELCTGELTRLLIEPGRRSDTASPAVAAIPPAGSLSLWDLGYFNLKRLATWTAHGAYWISRWPSGTAVLDPDDTPWDLGGRLRRHRWDGPLDLWVALGAAQRLPGRLIALRVPAEVAARRRQRAYQKAQKSGLTPRAEHLEWCDWTIFVTNCPADLLTWQEVVVLYRSRWQIELLFKLWKSYNGLAAHAGHGSVAWRMAEFWAKLIAVIVQHWLLLTTTWSDPRRSLRRAAAVLRDWMALLMEALADRRRLIDILTRMQADIAARARVDLRGKEPSWSQLLSDPLLLEYTY